MKWLIFVIGDICEVVDIVIGNINERYSNGWSLLFVYFLILKLTNWIIWNNKNKQNKTCITLSLDLFHLYFHAMEMIFQ